MTNPKPLPRDFYARPTLVVARDLLGARLVRRLGDEWIVGRIVETEAYIGETDPACHAFRGQKPWNAQMYGPPGHAYVHLTYGLHPLLNAVTESDGYPSAVLIRAVEPISGIETIRARRGERVAERDLTNGPGKLAQAFAIDAGMTGLDLTAPDAALFLAAGEPVDDADVRVGPRIGITRGLDQLWRFIDGRFSPLPARRTTVPLLAAT